MFCVLGEAMKNRLEDIINGFHQYVLSEPVHLSFVSRSLCEMTGFSEDKFLSDKEDLYQSIVHPADAAQYSDFVAALSKGEKKLTLQYRIIKQNGEICYVSDTMTSKYLEDGTLVGYSVLTDITELKTENDNLHFLNETIPCGFLKYTCEKQPKITYINEKMLEFLRFPETKQGEADYLELYKQNIYFMIPMEAQRRFAAYLKLVRTKGTPIAGEMEIQRFDGTKGYLFGWVTKCVNEQGVEEFQSACMDITESHHVKAERETKRYMEALKEVYDKIFEYDFANNTVKCLYGQNSPVFKWLENIPMQMQEATDKFIVSSVQEEDRERVQSYFSNYYRRKTGEKISGLSQIQYRAMSSSGRIQTYAGLFLKINATVSLFCCKHIPDLNEANLIRNENMQDFISRFSEGIAAFEVMNDKVTPLYASDNVCEFFGFTREEWLSMMKKDTLIRDFVSRSKVAYEAFAELLENGEAEFVYHDLQRDEERRIKAICSQKSPSTSTPRYIMLYNMDECKKTPNVYIRTFGYFDVFVDDKPIAFRNEKSKELFALLVDRRGGFVSSEEAISFLWEDETANSVTLARYRKVALRLKNLLEEYGISDIVESVNGKRRIATEKVQCDLFDYLSGNEAYAQLFKGNYLTNYSWGENTLAELIGDHM